ncbi:MAG: PD-(D/E)XK nuclease family protein [Elusimicrobiota bacterium]
MSDSAIGYVSPEIQSIIGVVNTHLRWKITQNDRRYHKYHPSAFGKCLRQMQYFRYAEEGLLDMPVQEFEPNIVRIFDNGHFMHDRWQNYFEDIGILMGVWECKNPFCYLYDDNGNPKVSVDSKNRRIYGKDSKNGIFKPEECICGCTDFQYKEVTVYSEEMNLCGHADLIVDFSKLSTDRYKGILWDFNIDQLPQNPIVIDMKTMNDYRWKQKLMKYGPSMEYKIQLCIYANLLDVDFGLLLYENKNNQDIRAFKVEKNTDTVFALIRQQAMQMNAMANFDPKKLPPPRYADKTNKECSRCPFKKICHNGKIWEEINLLNEKRNNFYGKLLLS